MALNKTWFRYLFQATQFSAGAYIPLKAAFGFSFYGWIPTIHMASIPDTEKDGLRSLHIVVVEAIVPKWRECMRENTYLGIPCLVTCQMSSISCLLTTERKFEK